MSRFEIGDGCAGAEIRVVGREDEIEDPDPTDEDDTDRPSRPVSTRNSPIRLPGYRERELDTRVQRREEG